MGGELEPGHLYFGITFGGLAWMGGEGAEGGEMATWHLEQKDRRGTWRRGRTRLGEEGSDGKQRREERRELNATKREIDLAFHSYFK
jgi:hypothetical protein